MGFDFSYVQVKTALRLYPMTHVTSSLAKTMVHVILSGRLTPVFVYQVLVEVSVK